MDGHGVAVVIDFLAAVGATATMGNGAGVIVPGVIIVVDVVIFTIPWNASNALFELLRVFFCIILVLLGLGLLILGLTACRFAAAVVDGGSAAIVVALSVIFPGMVG